MSNDKSPILYRPDYIFDPENQTTKRYYVLDQNGNKEQFTIALWDGTSIEAFLAHNVKELENYFECLTTNNHPCTYATRFKSLGNTLVGDALINWDELVEDDYPHVADKTQANYEKAIKDLITKLSDITYPGEPMKDFMKKINYFRCKDDEGNLVPPNKVLSRFKRMRNYGDRMHHTAPAGQPFISDIDFLKMYYDVFPLKMKNFVTEVKGCEPFNGITTVEELGQFFYSYYKMNLKNENEHKGKRKRGDEDNNDKKPSSVRGGGNKYDKRSSGKPKHQHKAAKGSCHITSHASKYFHPWQGCFLNPYSSKCDKEKADEFYRNEAKGNMSWYRNVYESKFGGSNNRYQNRDGYHGGGGRGGYNRDQGGRGRGNGGRGNGGRGNGGRGNGGRGNGGRGNYDSSHYNHDNSYHYQGNYNNQGQQQQQRNDHGNGGTNNVPPPQDGYYFGSPEAPPSAPMAPSGDYDRRNVYNGGGRW
jgi:hypothetical protein